MKGLAFGLTLEHYWIVQWANGSIFRPSRTAMIWKVAHLVSPVTLENRFGLGRRAGSRDVMPRWLSAPDAGYVPAPSYYARLPRPAEAAEYLAAFSSVRKERRMEMRAGADAESDVVMNLADQQKQARGDVLTMYRDHLAARYAAAVNAENSFAERLVHFWSNHFAVSADQLPVTTFVGLQELDAIRPHIFGSFADMLRAVEHHPAMLYYLNQNSSIGPNSPVGIRRHERAARQDGLNENLGREILELHTLGVKGGYNQADVTELARALTGFSVVAAGNRGAGGFQYVANHHEPGTRLIMGKRYAEGGEEQANAILDDLAIHPATARHLSTKLARHFVADDPPAPLVERLARDFLKTGGDLRSWYRVLLASPEAQSAKLTKFKTPWEWMVSAGRALDVDSFPRLPLLDNLLTMLGQPVWKPKSPAGYDDIAASWLASNALMRRVEVAPRLVALASNLPDARTLAPQLLGPALRPQTAQALDRAEDNQQAMALLLVSPEFLRR